MPGIAHLFSFNESFVCIELLVLLLCVVLGSFGITGGWVLTYGENTLKALARRPVIRVLAPGLFVIVGRLALLPLSPIPVPGVHDEFSYLLAADTFAHGRLANPTHPMWIHFETFHEIQQPTYASMYPPAQGMFLAAGELAGSPWLGVLLSVALMVSAIAWMIEGFLPPNWALAGGLLAAVRFGLFSYWIDSYWGGAVAALGGALVLGAAVRLLDGMNAKVAVTLAVGLLLLANTRPYEGLIFCLPVMLALFIKLWTSGRYALRPGWRKAMPAITVFVAGAALMMYYFGRVTGDPLLMPYRVNQAAYILVQPFIWQPPLPSHHYNHAVLRSYYESEIPWYVRAHTVAGWCGETLRKAISLAMFYVWPGIFVVLISLYRLWRDRKVRLALWAVIATFIGLSAEVWPMMLHYGAPLAGPLFLVLLASLRNVRSWTGRSRPAGIAISRAIPLLCLLMLTWRISAAALHSRVPEQGLIPWLTVQPGNLRRAQIEDDLQRLPGKHLVLVRYGANHDVNKEWVYNRANLDRAKVLWAREMDEESDQLLCRYFHDRDVWLIEPDHKPVRIARIKPFRTADACKDSRK